jgi:hypothetical protein
MILYGSLKNKIESIYGNTGYKNGARILSMNTCNENKKLIYASIYRAGSSFYGIS